MGRNQDLGFGSVWDFTTVGLDLDRSLPYVENCHTFIVPKPHLLPEATLITNSLKWNFLIIIILTTVIVGVCFSLVKLYYSAKFDFLSGFFASFRLITAGCISFPPTNQARLRFVLLVWYLGCVLLTTTYSAGLTSMLSKPSFTNVIRTKIDMYDNKLQWLDEDNTGQLYNFSKLSSKKQLMPFGIIINNSTERNRLLKTGKYGLGLTLTENSLLSILDLDDYTLDNLRLLQECDTDFSYVFVLKKNSALTRIVNEQLNKYREHGLILIWTKFVTKHLNLTRYDQLYNYYSIRQDYYVALNLRKLQVAFYLLVIGFLVSVGLFIFEFASHILSRRRGSR